VKSGKCLAEPGSRPKVSSPAELAACNTSANEKISFEGAFLVDRKLCVQTASGKAGAAITFATCNGNARQQWSINPNGTITWIQFTMCIADISGKVKLAKCTNPAADRWVFTAERP
jgi:Ricin-type beta-trefoil lectin domain